MLEPLKKIIAKLKQSIRRAGTITEVIYNIIILKIKKNKKK